MKAERIPAAELTPELTGLWIRYQESDPALDNPFFRPEFTRAVAAERDDVFVAVLSDRGRVGGFFPFQLCGGGVGRPVGLLMSNGQGVIAHRDFDWNAVDLVRGCGLAEIALSHVSPDQRPFAPYHASVCDGYLIDLSEGWERYVEEREEAGAGVFRRTFKKERRLERDHGPLEFVPYVADPALLDTLVAWKLERYPDTGSLTMDWAVRVCRRLMDERTPGFAGMLTALRAGDRVLALHMGVRSRSRLFVWFSGFDGALSRWSPGNVLVTRLAEWAAGAGVHTLDLGKGAEEHKRRFSNRVTPVAEVVVRRSPLANLARRIAASPGLRPLRALLAAGRGLAF